MASTAAVYVDVIARDRASKSFSDVGDSADKASSKMGKASRVMGSVAKVGALALVAGAGAAVVALADMTKGAIEDEAAQKKLAKTLKNAAGARGQDVKSVETWISKQGIALGVTDDELRPALGRLVTATGDVGKAQKLASLGMDVSAGTGKSLKQVSEALAKAQNGQVSGLSRLGIATKDANGKTKTFAQIQGDLQKQFGGQAKTAANTLEGKMGRLKLVMDETKETIGSKLIPVITTMATWFLNKGIPAISATYKWLKEKLGPAFSAIGEGIGVAIEWVGKLAPIFTSAKQKISGVLGGMSGDTGGNMAKIRDFIRDAFTIIRGIFTTTVSVIKTLWNVFGKDLVSFASSTFKNMARIFGGAFDVIRGVFKVFASLFKGDWKGVWSGIKLIVKGALNIIRGVLSQAWNIIKTLAKVGWSAIKATIGAALGALITKVTSWAKSFGNKIWDGIKAVGSKLKTIGTWIWNNVYPGPLLKLTGKMLGAAKNLGGKIWEGIKSVGGKLRTIGTWIWSNVYPGPLLRVTAKVLGAAKTMGGKIWEGVKSVGSKLATIGSWAWEKFKGGLERLKDRFKTAGGSLLSGMVNGLRSKWDAVKELTKKPLKLIVDVAINPFIGAVNKLLPEGSELRKVSNKFASGGAVRGPGSGTSDSIDARLSNGEHVLTAKEVANAGGQGAIYRMRQLLARGRVASGSGPGDLGLETARSGAKLGFAKGGGLDPSAVARAKRFASSQAGKPYIWGGVGPVGYDCSGFLSAITNVLLGRGPYSRVGTSSSFPWPGFKSGPGQFSIGAFTGNPGHVAGTLDGMNVESTNGSVRVGSAARGATNGMFTRLGHLGAGGPGFLSGLWGKFKDSASWFKDKIGSLLPKVGGGGLFSTAAMRALAQHIMESIKKTVPGFATGGVIKASPGGSLIRAGEGGLDEAIVPLVGGSRRRSGGASAAPIELHFHIEGSVVAERDLMATVARGLDELRRMQGQRVSILKVTG